MLTLLCSKIFAFELHCEMKDITKKTDRKIPINTILHYDNFT